MKRQIFIVDDKIQDAGGFLLTLHAVLADFFEESQLEEVFKDIEVFYIDVLWTDQSGRQENRKSDFEKICDEVGQHIKANNVPVIPKIEYKEISLIESDYSEESKRKEMANKVINCIAENRPKGQEDINPYVVLLDIILNENEDMGEILKGKTVLSTFIFNSEGLTDEHCIVYSNYNGFVYDNWKKSTGQVSKALSRAFICRGRAIDLEYQKWLLYALGLDQMEGGETNGRA